MPSHFEEIFCRGTVTIVSDLIRLGEQSGVSGLVYPRSSEL